jgi:hypothetical protein
MILERLRSFEKRTKDTAPGDAALFINTTFYSILYRFGIRLLYTRHNIIQCVENKVLISSQMHSKK